MSTTTAIQAERCIVTCDVCDQAGHTFVTGSDWWMAPPGWWHTLNEDRPALVCSVKCAAEHDRRKAEQDSASRAAAEV